MSKDKNQVAEVTHFLVISLGISQFTNRKFSSAVTRQIDRINGTKDAGRFSKKLLPSEDLLAISRKAAEIRRYHQSRTLPWGEGGDRMVPLGHAEFYVNEYMLELAKLKQEFEELVEDFLTKYPILKDQRRKELNGMFFEGEYPTLEEMRTKFGVRVGHQLTEVVDDPRLQVVSRQIADRIREQVGIETSSRHESAVEDMFARVKDVLQRIAIVNGDRKEGERRKFFKNSVIETLAEIIEVFPHLNYTKNAKIAKMTEELKSLLVEPSNLRGDDEATKKYAQRAKEIERKYFGV